MDTAEAAGIAIPNRLRLLRHRLRPPVRLSVAASLGTALGPWRRHLRREAVSVVLYHDPSPQVLDRHLSWLRAQGYRFVPLRALAEAVRGGDSSCLPPQSLVVTFDDGWRGNARLVPVLRQHRCPATIFVCMGLVGTRRTVWDFIPPADQPRLNAALKAMSNGRRLATLRDVYGVRPLQGRAARTMLSHEEMAEMAAWVDFQSHGLFHPLLPRCSEEELAREVTESKHDLEALTGRPVYAFAYPYGQAGPRERAAVAAAGYTLARTAGQEGLAGIGDDRFALPCVSIGDADSAALLRLRLAWAEIATLRRQAQARNGTGA